MKLPSAASVVMSLLGTGPGIIGVVDAQIPLTVPCPAAGGATVVPGASSASSVTVRIPIVSAPDGLCTLVRRRKPTGDRRAPVARSYASRGWEVSAGKFAGNDAGLVASVDCNQGGLHECDVTLPPLENEDGVEEEYVLESFERSVTGEEEAARFLEQVRRLWR
jgi:hypothetical protein